MALRAFHSRRGAQGAPGAGDLDLSAAAEVEQARQPEGAGTAAGAPTGAAAGTATTATPTGTHGPGNGAPDPTRLPDESREGEEPEKGLPKGTGSTVLAIGRPYFHDGTVGQGKYESELAPTLVAALRSVHALSQAVFAQVGAPADAEVVVSVQGWELRLGPEPGHAQVLRLDGHDVQAVPTERRAHQWLRGIAALRQSDHGHALAAFQSEAEEAAANRLPQRAAVAYRAAAASARAVGRSDQANRMLRLAGKYYLEIAEEAGTLPQGVFTAYREAARAFLEAGNLPLAHQSLTKAMAVGEALGLVERS